MGPQEINSPTSAQKALEQKGRGEVWRAGGQGAPERGGISLFRTPNRCNANAHNFSLKTNVAAFLRFKPPSPKCML